MKKLFGTDGIRGVAGKELSAEVAFRLGNALSQISSCGSGNKLLLAKDTRVSCEMLESAVASGAAAGGMEVCRCGIMPTPALALVTRMENTLGVMISASHNSYEYNGLKVLNKGFKLPDEEEMDIEEVVLSGSMRVCTHQQIGSVSDFPRARSHYLQRVFQFFGDLPLQGNHQSTGSKQLRCVVDTANGAAFRIAPEALRMLGFDVRVMNDDPDGLNINLECGSQFTAGLSQRVLEQKAQIGIAFDGDADRCILVDENGQQVDGDRIMGLCALYYKDRGALSNPRVITTVMSNLGLEVFLKKSGLQMVRTRVGDRYVLEEMLKSEALIGGEQSGHVIFRDKSTTGDGLITALTVLEAMLHYDRPLSTLVGDIPRFPQVLQNVMVSDREMIMESEKVMAILSEVRRELGEEGRVVLRPSGTEPLIRVMLEGKDLQQIEHFAHRIVDVVESIRENG
ncbi:MAG TPA: phosphoglucosamine mutase [Thermotogota bacterium]|nr:phosphoglucosamine mutase [Thermotogota bacterium]HRW92453.1 phosphoglucosamine mutase [Thermotogota bacterium]